MSDEASIHDFREEMIGRLRKIAVKATSEYLVAIAEGNIPQAEKHHKIVRIIEEMEDDMRVAPLSQLNELFKIRMEDIDRL